LNSTARYGQFEVGLKVCLGDREKFLNKAKNLLLGHRHNLVEGIQFAKEEGIIKRQYLQFFHAGTGIRDTIVGAYVESEVHQLDTTIVGMYVEVQEDEMIYDTVMLPEGVGALYQNIPLVTITRR